MSFLPDWLTGFDADNAAAGAAADAQLQAMNQADYAPGGKYYTPSNWAAVQADRASELAAGGYGVEDQRDQVDSVFTSSLDDSAKSILGTPLAIFWATVKSILSAIPWWLWLAAVAGIFVWLGGMVWLRGILAKMKK